MAKPGMLGIGALLMLVGAAVGGDGSAEWLAQARQLHGSAGDAVALHYRAAVFAYAALAEGPAEQRAQACGVYNASLERCLTLAHRLRQLDPRRRLLLSEPGGPRCVPVDHLGFVWTADDFDDLVFRDELPRPATERCHACCGLGVPLLALRCGGGEPVDQYHRARHPLSATVVLHPDLDAWLGRVDRPPCDRLVFHDPLRVRTVDLAGRPARLAHDFDLLWTYTRQQERQSRLINIGFLNPPLTFDAARLYMREPYQPGKVPLLLIHGILSSPSAWGDLVGDLWADPDFLDHYQVWLFEYPTGLSFLDSAAALREQLGRLVELLDPTGADPELRRMVLVGHSMGGLLAKLQVVASGDVLWQAVARRPFDQVRASGEVKVAIAREFFFEPVPFVARVVFVATPHRGSNLASSLPGCIASHLIREPQETQDLFAEVRKGNRGLLRHPFRSPPNSVQMLRFDNPILEAMNELEPAAHVHLHTVAGEGPCLPCVIRGDRVVPLRSSLLPGVQSELILRDGHMQIHHDAQTTQEIRRILRQHRDQAECR